MPLRSFAILLTAVLTLSAAVQSGRSGEKRQLLPDDVQKLKKQIGAGLLKDPHKLELDEMAMRLARHDQPESGQVLHALLLAPGKCGFIRLYWSSYLKHYPERVARELIPLLRDADLETRTRATVVLGFFRPGGHADGDVQAKKYASILPKIAAHSPALVENLRANLKDENATIRWAAAAALQATKAKDAAALAPLAVQWLLREEAPTILAQLGQTIPREKLAGGLMLADPAQASAAIFKAVATATPEARGRLAEAMATWPTAVLRGPLAKTLESSDVKLRTFGVAILDAVPFWRMSEITTALLPQVRQALESGAIEQRRFGLAILHKIPFGGTDGIPVTTALQPQLTRALDDEHADLRVGAVDLLRFVPGVRRERLVAVLTKTLADKDPSIRQRSAILLKEMGSSAAPARPELEKALGDTDASLRVRAAEILIGLDSKASAPKVLPVLAGLLTSWVPYDVRHGALSPSEEAATLAERLGPLAKSLTPTLVTLVNDGQNPNRLRIARVLLLIAPKQTAPALDAVREALANFVTSEHDIVRTVALLGPVARPLLPQLEKAFEKSRKVPAKAAWAAAIVAVSPDPKTPARIFLREQLLSVDARDPLGLLETLESFGRGSKSLVPELIAIMHKIKDREYVVGAIRVLEAIGPDAREALPLLDGLVKRDSGPSALVSDAAKRAIIAIAR